MCNAHLEELVHKTEKNLFTYSRKRTEGSSFEFPSVLFN